MHEPLFSCKKHSIPLLDHHMQDMAFVQLFPKSRLALLDPFSLSLLKSDSR